MSENLYHKLLGLPERLESPNYFDMLELDQGAIDANKVETAYKKQIQKVQRFTNNPKYKEGALFVKGELRKARSTMVDEARRMAYQRELMTERAQQVRDILRPLLIKGYLVDEEYKYLNGHAQRLGVPEPVVQQVLKQELQKKGIDPASALVEGSGLGGKVKSKAVPVGPQRKKKAAPMALSARFSVLRDPVGAAGAVCLWPLRLLGIVKSPAPAPVQAAQTAGFFDYHPYMATSLFWVGLAAFAFPLPFFQLKSKIDFQQDRVQKHQNMVRELEEQKKKMQLDNKTLRLQLGDREQKLRAAVKDRDAARAEAQRLTGEVARLKTELVTARKNGGGGNPSGLAGKLYEDLRKREQELADARRALDDLRKKLGQPDARVKQIAKERDDAYADLAKARKARDAAGEERDKLLQLLKEQFKVDPDQPLGKINGVFESRSPMEVQLQLPLKYKDKINGGKTTLQVFKCEWVADLQANNNPNLSVGRHSVTAQFKVVKKKEYVRIEAGNPVGVLFVK